MAEQFKISGKRVALPKAGKEWCLTERPGGWVLAERKLADGSIERRRIAIHESRGRLAVQLHGWAYAGDVQVESRGGGAAGGSDADLIAQFPGKVRKVLVKVGDAVEEGQPLLMVEAMKMEFPVKAPFAGKITQIKVTDGQQLAPGDRFLDLEPKSG